MDKVKNLGEQVDVSVIYSKKLDGYLTMLFIKLFENLHSIPKEEETDDIADDPQNPANNSMSPRESGEGSLIVSFIFGILRGIWFRNVLKISFSLSWIRFSEFCSIARKMPSGSAGLMAQNYL
uniref:Uncharacterized protein n=1 Tax=Megaselia scalaris TaxID=36166 RepID=T1GFH1_MEGSC